MVGANRQKAHKKPKEEQDPAKELSSLKEIKQRMAEAGLDLTGISAKCFGILAM